MVPVCPQGISLSNDNTHNCISVASFNLLAPLYIRPIDQRTGKVQPFASFEVCVVSVIFVHIYVVGIQLIILTT